ncbi:TetR/AcrR family transcriptional regulator [Thermomonospora echinospora]|uniref:TetR/AcrR family transcriptional regulator n=1 Tax=Thermomonospora echinospora TaxID=1992 RepID=UPI0013582FBD|nr:helix-turn-helix domain-containing protein [Thermomonospora echinospora]
MSQQRPTVRPYKGVSAAERMAQRRAAIMEAAWDLLGTEGWQAATVRGISSRAGLNDRYFYESFTDLGALLLAVVDDQAARGITAILEVARSAPRHLRTRTQVVVTAIFDFLAEDPRRAQVMAREFPASPLLQSRKHEIVQAVMEIFIAQVHELLDEVPLSPEDLRLTALTITAGIWETITLWLRGDLDTSRDHLIDYIVALLMATTALPPALNAQLP